MPASRAYPVSGPAGRVEVRIEFAFTAVTRATKTVPLMSMPRGPATAPVPVIQRCWETTAPAGPGTGVRTCEVRAGSVTCRASGGQAGAIRRTLPGFGAAPAIGPGPPWRVSRPPSGSAASTHTWVVPPITLCTMSPATQSGSSTGAPPLVPVSRTVASTRTTS